MSGKKGKKTKGKTMALQDFLGDTPTVAALPKSTSSWADDEEEDYGYSSRPKEPIVLPTAPRSARDPAIIEESIPANGPYVAYISNLPYDIDEQDVMEFFGNMNVLNMRLPKDSNMMKGYGYVEFEDKQSLIDALSMPDTTLKSRRLRIEVSSRSNDDRRSRMGRMGDREFGDDPERTMGDWRSARAPLPDDDRFRSRGGGFGGSRGMDSRPDGPENKPGGWRTAPREPMESSRPSFRDRGPGGPGEERGERDWNRFADRGRNFNRDGSKERDGGERGERGERGGFGSRRYDDIEREKERWGNLRREPREPMRETERDGRDGREVREGKDGREGRDVKDARDGRDSRDGRDGRDIRDAPPSSDAPTQRPKLALQPRSKPVEQVTVPPTESAAPAANIFGAAKPVDTAAREREIEERLAKSAEARSKEEEKRGPPREGAWGRRNGDDSDRSRPTWRSGEDRGRRTEREPRQYQDNKENRENRNSRESKDSQDDKSGSRGPPRDRNQRPSSRGPKQNDSHPLSAEETEQEELSRMPKAKDDVTPIIIASNKYSMLPDDVDQDNVEE